MKYGAIFMNIAHKQDTAAFLMDWCGPHYVYDEKGSNLTTQGAQSLTFCPGRKQWWISVPRLVLICPGEDINSAGANYAAPEDNNDRDATEVELMLPDADAAQNVPDADAAAEPYIADLADAEPDKAAKSYNQTDAFHDNLIITAVKGPTVSPAIFGGHVSTLDQPTTLSLLTPVEVELGCNNIDP